MLGLLGAGRDVGVHLLGPRGERRQREHVREERRRLGQLVDDRLRVGGVYGGARQVSTFHVLADGAGRRLHLGEPAAEGGEAFDQRGVVALTAERCGRVARALQTADEVRRRHLPRRAGVPLHALLDRDLDGATVTTHVRQVGGDVGPQLGLLARLGRVAVELPADQTGDRVPDRVVGDVGVEVVDVTRPEDVERAALLRGSGGVERDLLESRSLTVRVVAGVAGAAAATGAEHQRGGGDSHEGGGSP